MRLTASKILFVLQQVRAYGEMDVRWANYPTTKGSVHAELVQVDVGVEVYF